MYGIQEHELHQEAVDRILEFNQARLEQLSEAILAGKLESEEPSCNCYFMDVDLVDASDCPVHGKPRRVPELPVLKPITTQTVPVTAPEFLDEVA